MSDIAIRVEKLGKCYQIGQAKSGDFRQSFGHWLDKVKGRSNGQTEAAAEKEFWALQDVSFEIKQGEAVGIIGRNGAGKSTLLKILSRITEPSRGRFEINGRVSSLLEVGTGFHPELSGRENIYLNGTILGMKRREIKAKFDEIVSFSGVQKFIDTPVKHYSSGMKVRLAFSVAAHLEPEILIIDEVLAVGDAEFQKKCLGKMDEVSKEQGRTVLFVSHNMQAISTLTSDCVYLEDGGIKFIGNTDDSIKHYLADKVTQAPVYRDTPNNEYPIITLFEVVTSEPGNVHTSGKPLKVRVEISTPFAIDGAVFSFQIFDHHDRAIIHQWVIDSETPFARQAGFHTLVCEIDRLRLYMGDYSFTLHLSEKEGGRKFQTIKGICPFEVVMYGARRNYKWNPNACTYLEDSNWSIL